MSADPNQATPVVTTTTAIDFATGQPVTPTPGATTGVQPTAPTIQPPATLPSDKKTEPDTKPDSNLPKTQAEFDALIKVRLEAERKKFADYDDLKKKATELDGIKDAQKTEQEKLQTQLTELQTKNAQAEASAKANLIRAAVVSEAAKLGFADPADAYSLIDKAKLTVNESGEVAGHADLLTELAKAKPYLITRKASVTATATNPGRDDKPPERTDADRHRDYFGGGGGPFWQGGGVVAPVAAGKPDKKE